jgi:ion channel-forming bestrophin family protein
MLLDTKLPVRYIFQRILPDVIRVLLISICFQILKQFFGPELPAIPLQLPTILGSSISLLLAFKIGQSYDRWWEARRIWGAIVNDSRTLVMQVSSFANATLAGVPGADAAVRAVAYRQIAWCYSLGQALRGQDAMASLENYLPEAELAYIRRHTNKPLALLALHNEQIRALYQQESVNAFQHVQLDTTLVRLCDSMGAAERIKNTVFPTSYRLLVYFFIYLFLFILSLGLVESIGLWEVPVLLAIASTFFLLERTARYLQDPFNNKPTDTPVTAIARTVEINIRQLLGEQNVPQPLVAESYYLM